MGTCTVTLPRRTGIVPTGTGTIATITLSTSYATGGDTVNLRDLGVSRLGVLAMSPITSPAGHAVEIIYGATETTAPLLRVRDVATGTEISNATNLSTQSVRALVVGDLTNL